MKLSKQLTLVAMVLAGAALGQTQQPLQYRTGAENLAYHQIELTTNPPPGVALPKLNARPYFARWITPLDATRRALALPGPRAQVRALRPALY